MTTLSVVIPIYNSAIYLERCFKSLITSTHWVDEVILVNDGSIDTSQEIIENFDFKDIKTVRLFQANCGLSSARNLGIAHVTSDYFILLDSDDFINSTLIETIFNILAQHQPHLISYEVQRVSAHLQPIEIIKYHDNKHSSGVELLSYFLKQKINFVAACGYAYQTKFFKDQKFQFAESRYHEDFGLIPYVLCRATTVISIKHVGYYYVTTPNSIMRTKSKEIDFKKATDTIWLSNQLINDVLECDLSTYDFSMIVNFLLHTIFSKITLFETSLQKKMIQAIFTQQKLSIYRKASVKLKIKLMLFYVYPLMYQKIFEKRFNRPQ